MAYFLLASQEPQTPKPNKPGQQQQESDHCLRKTTGTGSQIRQAYSLREGYGGGGWDRRGWRNPGNDDLFGIRHNRGATRPALQRQGVGTGDGTGKSRGQGIRAAQSSSRRGAEGPQD